MATIQERIDTLYKAIKAKGGENERFALGDLDVLKDKGLTSEIELELGLETLEFEYELVKP